MPGEIRQRVARPSKRLWLGLWTLVFYLAFLYLVLRLGWHGGSLSITD